MIFWIADFGKKKNVVCFLYYPLVHEIFVIHHNMHKKDKANAKNIEAI